MAGFPSLACPRCSRALEYQVTIEMLDTPVGKIDTGYCPTCARLFERVRETNTFYESTLWPPLCRICRQPVVFLGLGTDEHGPGVVLYYCRDHAYERWTLDRSDDRWARIDE